jgi:hypothetical protein
LLAWAASRMLHWGTLRLLETVPRKVTLVPAGMEAGRGDMLTPRYVGVNMTVLLQPPRAIANAMQAEHNVVERVLMSGALFKRQFVSNNTRQYRLQRMSRSI